MDSVHHIWCPLSSQEYQDLPDGAETTLTEKAQAQSSKWLEAYHKAVSIGARYEERIAELESRTITVKQYDEFQICHYGATEDYAKGYIDCQKNFSKWLTASGIKVEAE